MKWIRYLIVLAMFGSLIASAAEETERSEAIRYADAEGTFYHRFYVAVGTGNEQIVWESGPTTSRAHSRAWWRQHALSFEIGSDPLHDCSNESFRCLFGTYRVFAVPRAGLSEHLIYSVAGSEFRVERCLGTGESRCDDAVVQSKCFVMVAPDQCALSGPGQQGPTLLFVYNKRLGIAAFGEDASVSHPAASIDVKLKVARKYLLRSKKGLLAEGAMPAN